LLKLQPLIRALHTLAIRFPEIGASVVAILPEYIMDSSLETASEAAMSCKSLAGSLPEQRAAMIEKLVQIFDDVRADTIYHPIMWVMAQYAATLDEVCVRVTELETFGLVNFILLLLLLFYSFTSCKQMSAVFDCMKQSLGELPLYKPPSEDGTTDEKKSEKPPPTRGVKIMPDGTYRTEHSPAVNVAPNGHKFRLAASES
jgi:hypothetical protein